MSEFTARPWVRGWPPPPGTVTVVAGPHTHPATDVTGLAPVARTGAYSDLSGTPVAMPALPHGHPASEVSGLHPVATSGDYNALLNKPAAGGAGPTVVKLTANAPNLTLVTLANIAGLSFPVVSGTLYRFRFDVVFRTPATTTGVGLGLTVPAFTTYAATARIPFAVDGVGAEFQGSLTTSGDSVLTTAVPAANTDYLAVIEGVLLPSANGTLQLQGRTEIAASAVTVRAGSNGQLWTV